MNPSLRALALVALLAACGGESASGEQDDPFAPDFGADEDSLSLDCDGAQVCPGTPGGGDSTWSSAYRIGQTATSQGLLRQVFVVPSRGLPERLRVRLRPLRPLGALTPQLRVELHAVTASGTPDTTGGAIASTTYDLASLPVNGLADVALTASTFLETSGRYALTLSVDPFDPGGAAVSWGVESFSALATPAFELWRSGARRASAAGTFQPSRYRPAGGLSLAFALTLANDTEPDAFDFADITAAVPSSLVGSDTVAITGFSGTLALGPASGSAAFELSTDGGTTWTTTGTAVPGATLRLRTTTSAALSATHLVRLAVGAQVVEWSVANRSPSAVDAIAVGPALGPVPGSAATSQAGNLPAFDGTLQLTSVTATPAGASSPALLDALGNAAQPGVTTFSSGTQVRLRVTPAGYGAAHVVTATFAGGLTVSWSFTTQYRDVIAYSGSVVNFPVPAGVTQITAFVWGAAGGGFYGPASGSNTSSPGGTGGFASGTINVAGITTLAIVVGGGGVRGTTATGAFGGGGRPGTGNMSDQLGAGGGLSGIFSGSYAQANAHVVAGGGGGGSAYGQGGNGGGANGAQGAGVSEFTAGMGGTGSGGGAKGVGAYANNSYATNGGALQGGHMLAPLYGGAAGGGGYFGGGSGTSNNYSGSSGGGGSGRLHPTLVTGGQQLISSQSVQLPPETTNPHYATGIGRGNAGAAGGHGLVVLVY